MIPLIVFLVIVGVVLYLVPMEARIKQVIVVLVILFVLLLLLEYFGIVNTGVSLR